MEHKLQDSVSLRPFSFQFRRYPRFFIIGAFSYIINIGLTFLLPEYAHLWYLISFSLAALVSLSCSFILNSFYTFRGYLRKDNTKRYTLYINFYIISALITFVLVYLLTSIFKMHYFVSITVITLISSFITYIINKKFIFLHI